MSDRLVKYKQLIEKHRRGLAIYWIDTDKEITADVVFDWLISELEQSRAKAKELEKLINKWRASVGLTAVMEMGWKDKAEKAEARLQQHDNYHCGGSMLHERSEEVKTENKKLKAEVKRFRAMLAIGHFVIRE